MKTLPEIMREYHQIEEMMMETGEITPEIEELLDKHDEDFDAKKDRYIGLIRHMESSVAEMTALKAQADKRIKTLNNAMESMRERLLYAMQTKGLKTARGGLYPASITHKTVTSVDIDLIPDDLYMELTSKGYLEYTKKFDKASIKKDYADCHFVLREEKDVLTLR